MPQRKNKIQGSNCFDRLVRLIRLFRFSWIFFYTYWGYVWSQQVWAVTNMPSYRSSSEVVGKETLEFEFTGTNFNTTEHIDPYGNTVPLTADESFSQSDGEFGVKYGLNTQLELRTGLRGRMNSGVIIDGSKRAEVSASGLESYFAGAKYTFQPQNPKWKLGFDGIYRQSAFTNENYVASNPYAMIELGDEVRDLGFGLHLLHRWAINPILTYSVMYFYRTNDFSNEIRYSVEGAYRWPRYALVGGLEGIYSLKTDAYSGNPSTKPPLYTRPTYLYNSVNRSFMAPYLGAQMTLGKNWLIKLQGKNPRWGNSTDTGYEILLSVSWQKPGESSQEAKVNTFKEYDVEASVVKISPREIFVKIDKGITDDIQKGMAMDIYQFNFLGGNILVASGVVYDTDTQSSIIKITHKIQDMDIKIGFMARGKIGISGDEGSGSERKVETDELDASDAQNTSTDIKEDDL